jgi:hypothetical protein
VLGFHAAEHGTSTVHGTVEAHPADPSDVFASTLARVRVTRLAQMRRLFCQW